MAESRDQDRAGAAHNLARHRPEALRAEPLVSPSGKPSRVLVAVDLSEVSRHLLETAVAWYAPRAEIAVVHVVDADLAERLASTGICSSAQALERMRGRAVSRLDELERSVSAKLRRVVVEGIPAVEIIKAATDLGCDLIVIGSLRAALGAPEILFGSTAERLLRGTPVPVLSVPGHRSES